MIYMITIVLSILVAINFLLLAFSCNKTSKRKPREKPFILRKTGVQTVTNRQSEGQLAATGS